MNATLNHALNRNYQLVIFDMDGTLVQSEDCASQALKDVIPLMTDSIHEVTHRYKGMRLAEIFEDIESRFPTSVAHNCLDLYRVREEELSRSYIVPCPGADDLLSRLQTRKCIASNAPVTKTKRSLTICDLSHHFDTAIFSAYDVNAWKPDPDLFLHAAHYHDVEPAKCLVVEDSDVGIQAALAAEMDVVHYDAHDQGSKHSVPSIRSLIELFDYVK
ncbi:HAD-IA family hydrolase [Granulosicoccus sp.]|nr:HAD-IA family hydrolase [Granulosicoccus sp.]MDB4224823.1 HAD-IA family hydrolase [Granulosicoccus sp.]